MTQMAKVHQQRWPQAFRFLSEQLPLLKTSDERAWHAFLRHARLEPADAQSALTMGTTPPLIFATDLGSAVWAMFDIEIPGRLEISMDVLDQFEQVPADREAQRFLLAKVLHEMCHWGCFRVQVADPDEAGEAFERDTFGEELRPWWLKGGAPVLRDVVVLNGAFVDPDARAGALRAALTRDDRLAGRQEDPQHGVFAGIDVAESMPRGFRNNNPGNIRIGDAWQGLADPVLQSDFQRRERSFCVFREPEWGLRAMGYLLCRYQSVHGLDTPRKIISRWAPASDNNNVESYSARVAAALGISADARLDTRDDATLITLLRAMARHENGDVPPYAQVQYLAALRLLS